MSYPQGPQQMPPSGNGNRGNGNPFKRNSPSDPNGNQKGNNSGGPQPFWKSPWLWGVLLVVMAVAGFQLFAVRRDTVGEPGHARGRTGCQRREHRFLR